jgi:hypothetical protein
MPLKSDHVDCTDFTDTIIDRAQKLAADAEPGDVITVTYGHPSPQEAYEMIAMSLRIKARDTDDIRYEQTLDDAHTFTVLT